MSKEHYHECEFSVTIAVPVVRMVAIVARDEAEDGAEDPMPCITLAPVVAIEVRLVDSWYACRDDARRPPTSPDPAAMIGYGWSCHERIVYRDAQFVNPYGELGLTTVDEYNALYAKGCCELIACPWPADEDVTRLAINIDRIHVILTERFHRQRNRKAAKMAARALA